MNIQRVDDVIFLAYIAKYICKPEPHGFLGDTAARSCMIYEN